MERYPRDVSIGVDDFHHSGWKAAVTSSKHTDCTGLLESLSTAARSAVTEGKIPEGKVLWLLADACSMILNPDSPNMPFKPLMEAGINHTPIPEDFSRSDIDFFSLIADEIDDAWLQARLADLVWLLKRSPRSPKHALMAIDAYRRVPLDNDTWNRGGRECWERAIALGRMLGAGAGERVRQIEEAMVAAFEATTLEDEYFPVSLAHVLAENHLAIERGTDIAGRLELSARDLDAKGDLHLAREFSAASVEWFRQTGDTARAAAMTAFVAETWSKEAIARTSSDNPSYLVAENFYEKAIQNYRSIPGSQRATLHVEERIAELRGRLTDAGARSLQEMHVTSSPPISIAPLVDAARNAVKGKSAIDALVALANVTSGASEDEIRKSSEELLRDHPLQAIIPVIHKSRDGRVIALRPGIDQGDPGSANSQATLWAEMVSYYGLTLGLAVQGSILPALDAMLLEHRLCERDFAAIAADCPVVPVGREHLFGKALFAGYEGDFVVALHLLVPQIENMVRCVLKDSGLKTATLNPDGTETENGLSTLMDLPESTKVFDKDLRFEIKALFCDPFGPNLRNELAHGLLDDATCQSVYAVYAWWFGLRVVVNTFWNARTQRGMEADVETTAQTEPPVPTVANVEDGATT